METRLITAPPDIPIYIPQPKGYAPVALWSLQQEGYNPVTGRCYEDYHYGNFVADAWQQGHGFVLVEHDIAPWWGACRELWECDNDWCVFAYAQGNGYPDPALGCSKYSKTLVLRFPRLHHDLRNVPWQQVQERLIPYLWNQGLKWHEHWPPVAHARQELISL